VQVLGGNGVKEKNKPKRDNWKKGEEKESSLGYRWLKWFVVGGTTNKRQRFGVNLGKSKNQGLGRRMRHHKAEAKHNLSSIVLFGLGKIEKRGEGDLKGANLPRKCNYRKRAFKKSSGTPE